jgi:hypothetical protein
MSIISEKIEGKFINVSIQSSNLKAAKYDTEKEVLEITFNNDSVYEYSKVPWSQFTKFRVAESQGKFFNTDISRKYEYKKLK